MGIGTATPIEILHVESADNNVGRFVSTTDSAIVTIRDDDTITNAMVMMKNIQDKLKAEALKEKR